ncbi:MAG: Wzz/FepE/Etk N-terminal domain-containing protein [Candidatus Muirbacterium halophilum]|nr:Wzz/FepE/Etk N-terminal domain-containing protein [Candidatus Muirbacterium halophilum]
MEDNNKKEEVNLQNQQIHRQYIDDDEIDLGELFRTLWKNKHIIIISTIIFFVIGLLYTYKFVPKYEVNYFINNGISGYNDKDQPIPTFNSEELNKWLETGKSYEILKEKYKKTPGVKVELPKNTNFIELKTFSNDTQEAINYLKDTTILIKESQDFDYKLENSKQAFELKIKEIENQILSKQIELDNFPNRIKEIDNDINKQEETIKVIQDKITEKKETLIKYRKIYDLNIQERKNIENNLTNSINSASSLSYLLYSNLLQYNLTQNATLTDAINNYENTIKDYELQKSETQKQINNLEIKKEELNTKLKANLKIQLDNLKNRLKLDKDKENSLTLYKQIKNKDYRSEFNKKVIITLLLTIFVGGFFGIVLIFIRNFFSALNNKID